MEARGSSMENWGLRCSKYFLRFWGNNLMYVPLKTKATNANDSFIKTILQTALSEEIESPYHDELNAKILRVGSWLVLT